ncbi:MAG TPA: 4-(cytidine 5'-diphospho)-2-C-methyl-D-erythritol kinase [Nitrospirae bacterium]|nr:4-diphosphocytidyl-2-C-methyl-D-erythritol kinase [bacterium BMS3Abin10]GBE40056.1 4-diphosphocytidyl-2-C-methyl-D-erythritol kinase [bacterium BMS3Bbin08]HDH50266.1 4-(cytidine 5'-diphospho)-2-C-methyl-D-erythritol kinase [Nitrospirota bacterium]HDK17172.1 4-(cytidine 5'-diphospho)-2-C-methyl-D-erythritol kinase [Nitrospirota bacterium]HDZ84881.1 4-(cytidine 5'-diphospho)-2-C-methyl-D-erythritol kinase [Nitrospirota bacterium]
MITLNAPAKINWFLEVSGLRSDGYHEIKSLIQTISLFDVISLAPSEELTLLSDLEIPDEQNLIYKAARLLKSECKVDAGAEIRLKKRIPVSAGLGGGSSDAASTLLGLNTLWSLGLSAENLRAFAGQLGSDVPFFLNGPLALVEGRGEKVTCFGSERPIDMLLVKPRVAVSTRWAYENLDASRNSVSDPELTNKADKADNTTPFIHDVSKAELCGNSHIHNDLESVTINCFPAIADIKNRMISEGAVLSMMSGSGPAVFGVFHSAKEAEKASRLFEDHWTAVVQTVTD